jgi:hypothetical protein
MTIEQSHGKARPALPRASDLPTIEADEKPSRERAAHGHFAAGNRTGLGARFTHTIKKALGTKASSGEAKVVARDARRVFSHLIRSMPSDAPPVRVLAAMHARHVALNAFYTTKAEAAGLDTPEGMKLLEIADRQSQRAERVLVTCLDVATKMAKKIDAGDGRALLADFTGAEP